MYASLVNALLVIIIIISNIQFYMGQMPFLSPNQVSKHITQYNSTITKMF